MRIVKTIVVFALLSSMSVVGQDKISLAGTWSVKLDPDNKGIAEEWWKFSFDKTLKLPGSLAINGIGNDVNLHTPWTGNIIDSTYFKSDEFEKYRGEDFKVPFWLLPEKYYKGNAWYTRTVDVPENWKEKYVWLNLERCHWETSVYVNGRYCGTQNSLVSQHTYDISPYLQAGENRITIRVNNDYIIPIGPNSSSITDHTQTNWNGIIGDISINAYDKIHIQNVCIYPNIKESLIKVSFKIRNSDRKQVKGSLNLQVEGYPETTLAYDFKGAEHEEVLTYQLPDSKLWDEFNPNVYELAMMLMDENGEVIHQTKESFGMREVGLKEGRIAINEKPVFLRGDVDCAGFPLTGYPSMDEKEWERIFTTLKSYGLNHLRFHSWCPPEVAFDVADRLGIYLYAEGPLWANQGSAVGTGGTVDDFIYNESQRVLETYGNHPSFIMFSYGNEPAGAHQNTFLGDLINYLRSKDDRRLYTSGAGWPIIPENDFHVTSDYVRIQGWGQELNSILNSSPPSFKYDWSLLTSQLERPVVSHEIGQWCAYPNFNEIKKYSGVLKAKNFEIFNETLEKRGMGDQADDFLYASGRLQTLCYKADIEAALRTPGFGGFQLLGLHDFPGQGTALVGALDAFWESKGYTSPEEYRTFCNSTVLLAELPKLIYSNNETINTPLEVIHFGAEQLKSAEIVWELVNQEGKVYGKGNFTKELITLGDSQFIGQIECNLQKIKKAEQLQLRTKIIGTDIHNYWDIWVYPTNTKMKEGNVLIVDELTNGVIDQIKNGKNVLYLAHGDIKDTSVEIGFSSIFWNTAWTSGQAPHTMGLAINPEHPVFKDFPTEEFSNYQWYELITQSQAMIINDFEKDFKPVLQPIDTWFENRKLAIGFETKIGKGKLFVTSVNLTDDMKERKSATQFKYSLLNYMNSADFSPKNEVDLNTLRSLFK